MCKRDRRDKLISLFENVVKRHHETPENIN